MHSWNELEKRLSALIAATERGPRRNGLFALWLVLRAIEGLVPPEEFGERGRRRRVEALDRRLSSLTLPPRLRKRIHATLKVVAAGATDEMEGTLADLAGTARETLTVDAAAIVTAYAASAIPAILERMPNQQ